MADTCCAEGSNRMIIWCAGASNVGQMTNQIAMELSEEVERLPDRIVGGVLFLNFRQSRSIRADSRAAVNMSLSVMC